MLCSIFEKPFTVHKDDQGVITLTVAQQMRPCTNHIEINYYHVCSFVSNSDVEI